jgi:hypothetical protein
MTETYYKIRLENEGADDGSLFNTAAFPEAWRADFDKKDFVSRGYPAKPVGPPPPAELVSGGFADYLLNNCLYDLC